MMTKKTKLKSVLRKLYGNEVKSLSEAGEKIFELQDKIDSYVPPKIPVEIVGATIKTIKGKDGSKGEKGDRGERGKEGVQGKEGLRGQKGEKGDRGEIGYSGNDGINGKNGRDGSDGKDGEKGDKGEKGDRGEKGEDGKDGESPDVEKVKAELLTKIVRNIGGGNMNRKITIDGVDPLTRYTDLNFIGGTYAINDATKRVDFTPAGGAGGGHTIQDEGVDLTQRTNLNFVGAGVTVTDGGAITDDTIVTIPQQDLSGYFNKTSDDTDDITDTATNRFVADTDISTWNAKQAALTFGIANTNSLRVDDASVADNDYAKFTANGLEGIPYATVLSDISGAHNTLNNLGTTAINTSLISDTNNTDDLGSSSVYWANAYIKNLSFESTNAYIKDGTTTGEIEYLAKVHKFTSVTTGDVAQFIYYSTTSGANLKMIKYRGTPAAPRRARSGDVICGVNALGTYAADDSTDAALTTAKGQFQFKATEAWTSTGQGSFFILKITPTGSATIGDVLTVSNDGTYLHFNITGLPTAATGLSAGDIWCDTSAGNVIKMV